MKSLTFTSKPTPEWDEIISTELRHICQGLSGVHEDFKKQTRKPMRFS